MENCLVKKLEIDSENNDLEFYNGLLLRHDTNGTAIESIPLLITAGKKVTLDILGDGNFVTSSSDTTSLGKTITRSGLGSNPVYVYISTDVSRILIRDCHYITELSITNTSSRLVVDIARFKNCTNITNMTLSNAYGVGGDITSVANLLKVTTLWFYNKGVTGKLEDFIEKQVALGRTSGTLSMRPGGCTFNGVSGSWNGSVTIYANYSEDKVEVNIGSTILGTYENGTWTYVS